ncbi:MAG: translation initiation factor IF-3 [Candidatus Moraniibacteriota bacterium]
MRRRRYRRPQPKPTISLKTRVNEMIRVPEVFLIDSEGVSHGVLPIEEALALAKAVELDLVEVSPKAEPPVCKILNFGKFQYQVAKQEQHAKTKQKKIETKGIRIGLRTDTHDLDFKRSQAEKFLKKGQKVKVEIVLKGREKYLPDRAHEAFVAFLQSIQFPYKTEEEIKRFPAGFHTTIVPE